MNKQRFYKIFDLPVLIKSDTENVLCSLDKIYGSVRNNGNNTKASLEIIINLKNKDMADLNNFEIYAVTPSTFDGWDSISKIVVGKSIVGRYVFEIKEPPDGIKLEKGRRLFSIKTRINEAGIRYGWLLQVNFHIFLFVMDRLKNKFHYFIHGGALTWKGKGIIVIALSGGGKSTLTYALTKAGFCFLTDETILVNNSSRKLYPYPFHPSFDEDGRNLFKELDESFEEDLRLKSKSRKSFLNLQNFGLEARSKPIYPDVILFPRYRPDEKVKIKSLPKSKSIELLRKNIGAYLSPKSQKKLVKKVAEKLVNGSSCYEITTNQLDETVDLVKEVICNHADGSSQATSLPLGQ